jgi:outer membrane lipoprotein-sorting protein
MRAICRLAAAGTMFLPILLTGCSFFPTTRKLLIPKAPAITQTVTPEELVSRLNQHWAAIDTITATVDIQASVIKTREGVAKDYPSLRGHILLRKPAMLRVLGQYLAVRFFDMASDGKEFTLSIPPQNKAIKGSNALKKKSVNALENLRPGFFFDALLVRGLEPDDLYSVTADTETVVDASKKHLLLTPEYVLSIMRRAEGSRKLTPVRVVTFNRDDLQPHQQDIYDSEGNLETEVLYAAYQDFDSGRYPSMITIKRPMEEIQVVLRVEDVKENQPLTDDQFVVKTSEGTVIQKLE